MEEECYGAELNSPGMLLSVTLLVTLPRLNP